MVQKEYEKDQEIGNKNNDQFGCCGCAPLKFAHYLIFYLFTITDMYCRIYPILLVTAYSHKRAEGAEKTEGADYSAVWLAWFSVLIIVLTFEAILYKNILMPGYNSWKTVFKQLYFATFTITFFLLSTMGLAYLERNVDFAKLLKWEFTGRMIIGFCFVVIITVHQNAVMEYDEWLFKPTLYGYYFMLIICTASGFALYYLKELKKQRL